MAKFKMVGLCKVYGRVSLDEYSSRAPSAPGGMMVPPRAREVGAKSVTVTEGPAVPAPLPQPPP